ncbi:ran-binding protein 17-like [Tympanuchus pallidicinctus]|uniref:ran-binding protein 17-like n=1 Tax=Tympanuchus pallidicinctus TaxID=109042 RepID=UPI00228703AB|nr:ran-binding protein 17-like [Tympanuchus pallidicinctus]XP_052540910.1 ran-binding protein 17-like [Tympanuchus pallidicinctus]XP_052540911.1 ran-binding protein 17-like [Tympanuchus pallidicinctus]
MKVEKTRNIIFPSINMQYQKLSQSYYPLLECLTQDHMDFITSLEPHVLICILTSVSGGLTAREVLLKYCVIFPHSTVPRPAGLSLMMSILMNTISLEDCRNQRSVSGPLLGLIALDEKYFSELRATLINSQPGSTQQVLEQCFRNLMKGVEQKVSVKNRGWFTQNVSVF